VTEVVEAIGKRNMNKFKEQYRNVDVFLVDDVQFFARKNSSQQEFFHTFNELYDHNKQIVITSDRAPSELDDLDERLKSRFGMGMVVELLSPDFETRVAILNQKCREFEVLIDPEVINFIATNVEGSIRGLEGVLRAAIAESQLANRVPTIRSVAEIIRRLNKAQDIIGYDLDRKRAQTIKNMRDVINVVSEYYGINMNEIVGKARKKDIMIARQVCMYLIKNELGDSYEKIGSGFGGRNHTTVMHACNKVADKLKTDIRLVRDLNALKRDMGL
jgi:chromosomal replication initiator protein